MMKMIYLEVIIFPSSILGGVIMVGGLYSVLWAKRSEDVDVRKQQMAAPAEAAEV